MQFLRSLTASGEPVRSQACGVLAAKYLGQDDCLRAIIRDPNERVEIREAASRELEKQIAFRPRLLESLKDPATLAYLNAARDNPRRIREELEAMLLAPDAILHERVCTALKRYFPYASEPGCPQV